MLRHLLRCTLALVLTAVACVGAFLLFTGWRATAAQDQVALTAALLEPVFLIIGALFVGISLTSALIAMNETSLRDAVTVGTGVLCCAAVAATILGTASYAEYRQAVAYLAEPTVTVEPHPDGDVVLLTLPAQADTIFGQAFQRPAPAAALSLTDARRLERLLARQRDPGLALLASRL